MPAPFRPAAILAAALVAFAAAPTVAQPAADCRAVLAAFPVRPAEASAEIVPDGPDGCRFGRMRFALGGPAGYEVASVLVRGFPLAGPPRDLRVEARGIVLSLRTGTAVDWVTAQARVPFDVIVDLSYDAAARRLTLREASLSGEALGRVSLDGVAEGVEFAGAVPDPTLGERVGLRALRVRMAGRRWVQEFLLPTLTSFLPNENTGAAVEAAKGAAETLARDLLPRAGATGATVEAVAATIRDFPQPRHPLALDVTVRDGPPLTLGELVGGTGPDRLAALLPRLRVEATYEGDFP